MKIKSNIFICFIVLLVASLQISFPYKTANAYTVSRAESVMEMTSGRVLSSFNSDEKLPMASTTKVLTALTVIENYDLSTTVTVPKECVGIEGSSVYLQEGEKFTVKDLLYGLMLRSGNDCAETLAVILSGSIEEFVKKMNETAKKYGANSSNFVNPHGLPNDNHYTTASDLCKISCVAMKNCEFKEIVSSKKYTATEINSGRKILWVNKNKLLSSYDGANGVKTGYTVSAGRCLVSAAEKDGMQVVSVVLNSPQMFERSKELLDYAFDNYKLTKIVDKEKFDYDIISSTGEAFKIGINEDFYYPVKNGEKISATVDIPENFKVDLKKNLKVGDMKIYCQKHLIFSQGIFTL